MSWSDGLGYQGGLYQGMLRAVSGIAGLPAAGCVSVAGSFGFAIERAYVPGICR
jgi:hypothetical protein